MAVVIDDNDIRHYQDIPIRVFKRQERQL